MPDLAGIPLFYVEINYIERGDSFLIDDLSCLKALIIKTKDEIIGSGAKYLKVQLNIQHLEGEMYCLKCGGKRRMSIFPVYLNKTLNQNAIESVLHNQRQYNKTNNYENYKNKCLYIIYSFLSPSLWQYTCLQCKTVFTALIYDGADGQALAVLPSCHGGIRTPNTPESVAYYLSQASLSKSVGANSAAMAMFRAALEQILFEQGYTGKSLGNKLNELNKDINNNTAPEWAMKLETEFLEYMEKLGNRAIHANEGDVEKQKKLDNELLSKVEVFFSMLLFRVYELKKQQEEWLNEFKAYH